jgi:hypothetical protein
MKGRYLELYTYFGFEKVFGTETNRELLLDLLNELIDNMEYIADLNRRQTERRNKLEVSLGMAFDIYCETERGERKDRGAAFGIGRKTETSENTN